MNFSFLNLKTSSVYHYYPVAFLNGVYFVVFFSSNQAFYFTWTYNYIQFSFSFLLLVFYLLPIYNISLPYFTAFIDSKHFSLMIQPLYWRLFHSRCIFFVVVHKMDESKKYVLFAIMHFVIVNDVDQYRSCSLKGFEKSFFRQTWSSAVFFLVFCLFSSK